VLANLVVDDHAAREHIFLLEKEPKFAVSPKLVSILKGDFNQEVQSTVEKM
jgi:hypothetical protein